MTSEILQGLGAGFIIAGVILFVVMWLIAQWLKRVNARLDDQLANVMKQLESKFIHINIEVDNGMYFCYNKQDNSFVCQGTTAREIRDAFNSRYPDKVALLEDADREDLAELKAQILEMKEQDTQEA